MKLAQAKLTECFRKSLIISEITEEVLKKDGVLILMSLFILIIFKISNENISDDCQPLLTLQS
jgi:hypothetical protein